jgi:hypothetical protein
MRSIRASDILRFALSGRKRRAMRCVVAADAGVRIPPTAHSFLQVIFLEDRSITSTFGKPLNLSKPAWPHFPKWETEALPPVTQSLSPMRAGE